MSSGYYYIYNLDPEKGPGYKLFCTYQGPHSAVEVTAQDLNIPPECRWYIRFAEQDLCSILPAVNMDLQTAEVDTPERGLVVETINVPGVQWRLKTSAGLTKIFDIKGTTFWNIKSDESGRIVFLSDKNNETSNWILDPLKAKKPF